MHWSLSGSAASLPNICLRSQNGVLELLSLSTPPTETFRYTRIETRVHAAFSTVRGADVTSTTLSGTAFSQSGKSMEIRYRGLSDWSRLRDMLENVDTQIIRKSLANQSGLYVKECTGDPVLGSCHRSYRFRVEGLPITLTLSQQAPPRPYIATMLMICYLIWYTPRGSYGTASSI